MNNNSLDIEVESLIKIIFSVLTHLTQSTGNGECDQLPDHSRVSLNEADELQTLASDQQSQGQVDTTPLVHSQHHVTCQPIICQIILVSTNQMSVYTSVNQSDVSIY